MGKPSLFWAEPTEIAALVARLDGPSEEPQSPTEGTPSPQGETPRTPPRASSVPHDADSAQLSLPELWLPETTLDDRLRAFLEWLASMAGSEAMFLADAEGLPLASEGVDDELLAALATLGGVWCGLRQSWEALAGGRLILDFAESRLLHLLAVETPWGWLHLGFVAEQRLERPRVDRIRDALVRTVESQGAGSR